MSARIRGFSFCGGVIPFRLFGNRGVSKQQRICHHIGLDLRISAISLDRIANYHRSPALLAPVIDKEKVEEKDSREGRVFISTKHAWKFFTKKEKYDEQVQLIQKLQKEHGIGYGIDNCDLKSCEDKEKNQSIIGYALKMPNYKEGKNFFQLSKQGNIKNATNYIKRIIENNNEAHTKIRRSLNGALRAHLSDIQFFVKEDTIHFIDLHTGSGPDSKGLELYENLFGTFTG